MKMKKEGNLVESIPEEIWIEIFEIGVKRSILYLKDLHSISITCKLFNKLWSEDSIWSILLALDSRRRFASDRAYSSCNQAVYKYRLGRLAKTKFAYIEHQIQKNEDRMSGCSYWAKYMRHKLSISSPGACARIHLRIGMGIHQLEELSELLASGMGKGDQVIALCRRASFALGTLANAHSPCTPVDCSSSDHSLVGLEKKIDEVLSVMRDKASNYYRKDVFCILLRNQLENIKQLVVLTSRLVYLSSGSNPIETGGSRDAENDHYYTDDDDDDDGILYNLNFCRDITDNDDTDDDNYGYDVDDEEDYSDEGEGEGEGEGEDDVDVDVDHDHYDAGDDDHNDEGEDEDDYEIVDEEEDVDVDDVDHDHYDTDVDDHNDEGKDEDEEEIVDEEEDVDEDEGEDENVDVDEDVDEYEDEDEDEDGDEYEDEDDVDDDYGDDD